jgi:hypothetical protein
VSTSHPHSKLITAAAREILRPLGLVQKGRSRIWFDDRGWCLGVVEFQPSSWSRGSYLNVGVNFLWNPKSHISFDLGYRVQLPIGPHGKQYVEFVDEQQFMPLAHTLAETAADEIVKYRSLLPTPRAAAVYLTSLADHNLHTLANAGHRLRLLG